VRTLKLPFITFTIINSDVYIEKVKLCRDRTSTQRYFKLSCVFMRLRVFIYSVTVVSCSVGQCVLVTARAMYVVTAVVIAKRPSHNASGLYSADVCCLQRASYESCLAIIVLCQPAGVNDEIQSQEGATHHRT